MKRAQRSRSLAKGALAGLIGGIVATAAKAAVERVYPPRPRDRYEPRLLEASDKRRTLIRKVADSDAVTWGVGAATGAAYGALVELYPAATAKQGASFGMAFAAFTQDGSLSALGLAPKSEYQSTREKTSELASHIVYGVVTETVRRVVRRVIA